MSSSIDDPSKVNTSAEKKRKTNQVIIRPTTPVGYLGEVKTEIVELPASFKVKIKICEMSADMAKLALLIVITDMQQDFDYSEIAQELKKCFDAACPIGPWHAVVGEAFYSIATHRKGYYLFFCVNKLKVILYKCRDGE